MKKILIANRGEIAVRVIRACRDMGIATVAIYSDCDRAALHVRLADEAWPVGPSAPRESYLRIDTIVEVAKQAGADAVHPGYGFLAENEDFAAACRDAGLIFIGPSPEAIAKMGSKTAARQAAIAAGVPVVPGTEEPIGDQTADADVVKAAARIGYPLMLKAVAGGGGKGMRTVAGAEELPSALRAARSEAQSSFGDGAVYLERRILSPRHIEVQLLADHHGTVLPFVERECSIQRRHQKIVEESPSLAVSPDLRRRMTSAAAAVARAVGYTNAGTIEFLLDADGSFYFLEMNTRLQVEHPITEMVTGVDLVQWQIRIARGERLDLDPELMLTPRAHAIECRIYAEDPDNGFMPSPGRITGLARAARARRARRQRRLRRLGGADLLRPDDLEARDLGRDARSGDCAHEAGAGRIRRARHPHDDSVFPVDPVGRGFPGGAVRYHVHRSQDRRSPPTARCSPIDDRHEELAAIAAAVFLFTKPSAATAAVASGQPLAGCRAVGSAAMTFDVQVGEAIRTVTVHRKGPLLHVEIGGRTHVIDVRRVGDDTLSMLVSNGDGARPVDQCRCGDGRQRHPGRASTCTWTAGSFPSRSDRRARSDVRNERAPARPAPARSASSSPMPGKVVRVLVKAGDEVKARQGLVVVEAMKMENELRAARDGRVREVAVTEGQSVEAGTVLMVVE